MISEMKTIYLWWKSFLFLTKWFRKDLENEDALIILIILTSIVTVTVTITISVTDGGVTGRVSVAKIYFKRLAFNPEGCDPSKNADW